MISVHQPSLGEAEMRAVTHALQDGEISGSSGYYIERFEYLFARYCGCQYGVAVSSGTAALHIAMRLADIQPNDEVLVNACTNIACGNAIVETGGIVVPVDSEPDTWNMNTTLLEELVTPRTRVIMPVHIYGHPVDMNAVTAFADKYHLFVIEDCAEAHGALYWDRKVGSFGDVGCFSFYANKVITTGEGGMLVTNDARLAERARSLRNLCFDRPRFVHYDVGYNYRMTNLQAALGCAQLDRINSIVEAKRALAARYSLHLRSISDLQLPVEKDYARSVYWMYGVVVPENTSRDKFTQNLSALGVDTRTMFCPMNLQPSLIQRNQVKPIRCPVAERLWCNGLYLPSSWQMSEEQFQRVVTSVRTVSQVCA